jgi:hypothetical protein
MAASISNSISNLADQVTRLAQSIDRLIAIAEVSKQRLLAIKDLSHLEGLPPTEVNPCPLASVEDEVVIQTLTQPSENVFATSIADLYDRLGGFLETALLPAPQNMKSSEHVEH